MNANLLPLPRILIIDDLYGRSHIDQRNQERSSLCGLYLLQDITDDDAGKGGGSLKVKQPLAQAVFFRGQQPAIAHVGDTVENDLDGTLRIIADGWLKPPYWSLVLLDLCFYTGVVSETSNKRSPGMPEGRPGDDDSRHNFGLTILAAIKDNFPGLPVVVLSGQPENEVSFNYTKLGALGFIPRAGRRGPELLEEHLYKNALVPDFSGEIVGNSKALMFALREIRRSAVLGGRRNILFRGETGTGKKLFAAYAHNQKQLTNQESPFVVVNCPQLNQENYTSELFGHKKGSFTDAKEDKQGSIEIAHGGDVFLDEIAELHPRVQAGVLKVIEERVFTRLGETKSRTADVRFLSATNSTLIGFRDDLLMRLIEGGTITLPPLRERKEDIPLLVEKFVREAEQSTHARERKIEATAVTKLMGYSWPGNVRELQNRIYEAVQQYSSLPYLIPDHITLPGELASSFATLSQQTPADSPVPVIAHQQGFTEYALPHILRDQSKSVVEYVISALEYCKDKRNNDISYPKTWHAMTGLDIKSSSTCQRNIGNYIFQLENDEIIQFMKSSVLFSKAVLQCGKKIQSAQSRVAELEMLMTGNL